MGILDSNRVALNGSTVVIGATTFQLDGPRTLYGLAANRPAAADAHAAVPWAYYVSVDTQAITQTDGTNWVTV